MNLQAPFQLGQTIPKKYVCKALGGSDLSPPLSWDSVPKAKSYAVMCYDLDIPKKVKIKIEQNYWFHWLVYNLTETQLQTGQKIPLKNLVKNTAAKYQYVGMCPPNKSPHRYRFCVYALKKKLNKIETINQFIDSVNENKIKEDSIIGLF